MAESSAWENPLMPNARLRQIYLAMMQARTIARAVPPQRGQRSTLSLEACLVSPTVDLGPGDLVSDVLAGGAVDFLRNVPGTGKQRRRLNANCGRAAVLPRTSNSIDRIWTAAGAAAALQSLASRTRSQDAAEAQPGVTVVYLLPDELPPTFLKKTLTFAREKRLPLILIMLPAAKASTGARTGRISELALRCGVPAIPTDAADTVAMYRVTQEAIGHARIGGGPAMVECVSFAITGKRATAAESISSLAQYMLSRRVVTQAWLDRETKAFAKRLASILPNV